MGFEQLILIAEITTEDGAQYGVISACIAAAAWFGLNMLKPWFSNWLEERKLDRESKRKRDDAVAQAQIDEARQRTIDRKDADNRLLEALVKQGKDDQAHMDLLTSVVRVVRDIAEDMGEVKGTLSDIYGKMGIDRNDRHKPVRPAETTGQPATG